jgi:hypothetical protein
VWLNTSSLFVVVVVALWLTQKNTFRSAISHQQEEKITTTCVCVDVYEEDETAECLDIFSSLVAGGTPVLKRTNQNSASSRLLLAFVPLLAAGIFFFFLGGVGERNDVCMIFLRARNNLR